MARSALEQVHLEDNTGETDKLLETIVAVASFVWNAFNVAEDEAQLNRDAGTLELGAIEAAPALRR